MHLVFPELYVVPEDAGLPVQIRVRAICEVLDRWVTMPRRIDVIAGCNEFMVSLTR